MHSFGGSWDILLLEGGDGEKWLIFLDHCGAVTVWRGQAGLTCHSLPFAVSRCRSFMLCVLGEKWTRDGLIYHNCVRTAFAFDFPPDGAVIMAEYFAQPNEECCKEKKSCCEKKK